MPIETISKSGKRRFRWTFERVIEGERIRKTKLLPAGVTAAEADKIAREWEAEIYAIATGARKPVVTIGECVRKHITDKQGEWKDAEARVRILEKWRVEYDDAPADELHDWSVTFIGYLRSSRNHDGTPKRPLTDASIRNILAYIRAAVKYMHKIGKIEHDNTKRMVFPAVNNERHAYPQRADMLRIARLCQNREVRAAILIAFYSGMRRSEILRAKVTKKGFSLADTKNGTPRIVPVHRKVSVWARRVKFTISDVHFSDVWDRARIAAGLPHVRFHDLRHGAASEMINAGVDLYTVGAVLGHKSMVSTKRYSHLVTDRLSAAVDKIGKR